jgi:hypothetical protein
MGHDKNHALAGADHTADTIANLNTKLSDAFLRDASKAGSTGVISGGAITDGGSGTVDISLCDFYCRDADSRTAQLGVFQIAASVGFGLTDNASNFIYASYNGGTPAFTVSTSPLSNVNENVVLGIVYRNGNTLHITNVQVPSTQVDQIVSKRFAFVDGITRQSGTVTTEVGTRSLAQTAGAWWFGMDEYSISAEDTTTDPTLAKLRYYLRDGVGGWNGIAYPPGSPAEIDNNSWDDGSGSLQTLSNNRYGVTWVYRGLDGDMYWIYGQGDYTLTEAQNAQPPTSLPPHMTTFHAFLTAKCIVLKGATNLEEIEFPWVTAFVPGSDPGAILANGTVDFTGVQHSINATDATGLTGQVTGGSFWTLGGIAARKKMFADEVIESGQQIKGNSIQVLADKSWGATGDAGVIRATFSAGLINWDKGSGTLPFSANIQSDGDTVIVVTKNSATAGDVTAETKGGVKGAIKTVDATPYVVLDGDHTILLDDNAGTVNLPACSANTGRELVLKRIGTASITLEPDDSTEAIDGAVSDTLATQWDFRILKCDGSNWFIVGTN